MADQVLDTLKSATEGLLYPSETDAPFEPFAWEVAENSVASVRRLSGQSEKEKCRAVSLETLFWETWLEKKSFSNSRRHWKRL